MKLMLMKILNTKTPLYIKFVSILKLINIKYTEKKKTKAY